MSTTRTARSRARTVACAALVAGAVSLPPLSAEAATGPRISVRLTDAGTFRISGTGFTPGWAGVAIASTNEGSISPVYASVPFGGSSATFVHTTSLNCNTVRYGDTATGLDSRLGRSNTVALYGYCLI